MLTKFAIVLLCVTGITLAAQINYPDIQIEQNVQQPQLSNLGQWGDHIKDFVKLIDIEKVMSVLMPYLKDEEVIAFLGYVMSPEFGKLIMESEAMEEFREATEFLTSKGYDVVTVINLINKIYELPPYERSAMLRNKRGISDMIVAVIQSLPVDQIKELFEQKLQNNKEVEDLFNTVTSEEFVDILKRMSRNPTFLKAKQSFEDLGFDFQLLCSLAQKIFGDYYLGIFCDDL